MILWKQRFNVFYSTIELCLKEQLERHLPPAQLLMGRQLRTRLDFVVPNVAKRVQDAQTIQKDHHDSHCKEKQFSPGDQVMVRNYPGTPQWLPGNSSLRPSIISSYLADGRLWRRHQDQLLKATNTTDVRAEPDIDFDFDFDTTDALSDAATSTSQVTDRNVPETSCRRSSRIRQPPDRLTF